MRWLLAEGTVISTSHDWQRALWWVLWHFICSFYYRIDSMSSCVCINSSFRFDPALVALVCACVKNIFFYVSYRGVSSVSLLSNGAHIFHFFLFYSSQLVVWVCVEITWEFNFFRSFHFFAKKFWFDSVLREDISFGSICLFCHSSYWRKSIAARERNIVRSTKKQQHHEFGYITYDIGHCSWHCRNIIPQLLYLLR